MTNSVRTLAEIDAEIKKTKEALADVHGRRTEVYARIVGYYRSVRNWNKGKRDEYNHRKMFVYDGNAVPSKKEPSVHDAADTAAPVQKIYAARDIARYELFARRTCPNCPPVKEYMAHVDIPGAVIDVDSDEGLKKASAAGVMAAPTVIMYNASGEEIARAHNTAELEHIFETAAALGKAC